MKLIVRKNDYTIRRRDPGKNPSLTEELVSKYEEFAGYGIPDYRIAYILGIHRNTFHRWTKQGRDDEDNGKYDTKAYKFFVRKERAIENREQRRLLEIEKVGFGGRKIVEIKKTVRRDGTGETVTTVKESSPNWKALAWMLERLNPEKYRSFEKAESIEDLAEELVKEIDKINASVPTAPPEDTEEVNDGDAST